MILWQIWGLCLSHRSDIISEPAVMVNIDYHFNWIQDHFREWVPSLGMPGRTFQRPTMSVGVTISWTGILSGVTKGWERAEYQHSPLCLLRQEQGAAVHYHCYGAAHCHPFTQRLRINPVFFICVLVSHLIISKRKMKWKMNTENLGLWLWKIGTGGTYTFGTGWQGDRSSGLKKENVTGLSGSRVED